MRSSSGLLLVGASSALGQFTRFTNSSTSAVESATTSIGDTTRLETTTISAAPTETEFALNLKSAKLGPGASFYPPPDGDSILLLPGSSSPALARRQGFFIAPAFFTLPFFVPTYFIDPTFVVVWSFTEQFIISRKRAEASDCVLEVLADGVVVAVEPINALSQGTRQLSSNPFKAGETVEFTYRETCGSSSRAIGGIVGNVAAKLAPEGATSTPIPLIPIRTEPTTTTNGESATSNSEDETVIPTETNSEGATTNSEGETVIPTETATVTNSEGATTSSEGETVIPTEINSEGTTNSEGETVIPTETATVTNSEGATTSSEGETGETVIHTGTATSTISSPSSTATSPAGFPGNIGAFSLFGCVGSTAGFPSFTLAQSSESMDLEACAALCEGRNYFGVYDIACYCGDVIDAADTSRVTLDLCDIECPGDDAQFCGGETRSERLRARQNVPDSRLLTVYAAAEAAVTITDSVTHTVTDQETIVTTYTTTVTGALSTATQAVTATLVCFAGKCYSSSSSDVAVYIFIEINGSDFDGQWVYISESCSCAGGQRYIPKFCSGGSCSGIKVYKPQKCHDWYNYNNFFVASDCNTCAQGKFMFQPWENSWGTPDNCNGDVPVCNGYGCPSPHNGGGPQHGGHNGNWNSTAHGGSNGGSQSSPKGGSNSGSKGGYNGGSHPSSNGGTSSGSQGSHGSNGDGSKNTQPSIVPVISGAGKQAIGMLSLLAVIAALF
ncbi:hypothetical protein IWW34DRAFT_705009 [Fusarium oxysporum f. sp. albedinis]|nr:hypothetical protein IWW34DRAFT_705009 [Fusarium oxysporum f. sp. albedinis]